MSEFIKKNITKTKSKKKKVKAFHQKVKVFRATDPKMAVLMWGISHSISQLSHVAPRVMLLKDDFKAYSKIKIDNHFYNKENMPGHFKFKEYMPLVFQNLRERFNVDDKLFTRTFLIQPQQQLQNGHSGSKFYLTDDKMYWVKTMVKEEVALMHDIMPMYHQYIVESHNETLLPQYLAMYRTTVDTKEFYYIVVRNIFSPLKKIHKKYDLKGSRVDRAAKATESEAETTLKDNDFVKDNMKLYIGTEAKTKLLDMIKRDVEFLSSINVMDYSLLVGIHDSDKVDSSDNEEAEENEELDDAVDSVEESSDGLDESQYLQNASQLYRNESICSETHQCLDDSYPSCMSTINPNAESFAIPGSQENKNEIYYIGIIDVLSYYGPSKKAAHAAKTVKHRSGAEISTVKPPLYASRFIEFMVTIFE